MFTKYQLENVIYAPYDKKMPVVAGKAIDLLSDVINKKIYHFGSTAVPGMPGKNIINLFVSSPIDEFNIVLKQLELIGFSDHPYRKEPSNRPLKVAGLLFNGKTYGIHVHVLETGSRNEQNALFFCDYLINHPGVAEEYAKIKEQNIKNQGNDPEVYRQAKNDFILSILQLNSKH